ncbi:hypothetical protein LIER_34980 [Lithospermum erythrorhizon]|uniref:Uncharacterized protein n=1 Tax=Lithospermum erythrorhizon TaxID=34254 RepID=A0AAV3NI95_LITER
MRTILTLNTKISEGPDSETQIFSEGTPPANQRSFENQSHHLAPSVGTPISHQTNMSGLQHEPNASVPPASNQHAPFPPEVEATFQQRLREERAAWERERGVPEYHRSHHETQYSHESEDRDQSLPSPQDEVHSTSTALERRKNKSATLRRCLQLK